MKKPQKIRDGIFLVTEDRSCPVYSIRDELKVENSCFSASSMKPSCLILTKELTKIAGSKDSFGGFTKFGAQKSKFTCGGCEEGLIRFEYKKEKDFATLQMKLLNEAEAQKRRKHLDKFFGLLRKIKIFEPLDDDALSDLTALLDLKKIPADKVILKKGAPGTQLLIILSGNAVILADDGQQLAEAGPSEILGEMGLLSGEPVSASVHTTIETHIAILSGKNFKHVLFKHPVLQIFLLRMMMDRAQAIALRAGSISSGMTGELSEIDSVDLFQLINSSQKTGTIDLILKNGTASVYFYEGEVIEARLGDLTGKDAFFTLLGTKHGHFSYIKGIPEKIEKLPPMGGFMGLVMEGVQKLDEESEDE